MKIRHFATRRKGPGPVSFRHWALGVLVAVGASLAPLGAAANAAGAHALVAAGAAVAADPYRGAGYGPRYGHGRGGHYYRPRAYAPRYYGHGYYGRRYAPRYYAPRYYGARYYGPRYYGPRYYGPRYYGRGHGISGGEAALIAAGIIGGVILIDRALDERVDDRRHDDDRFARSADDRRGPWDDDVYYRRDDRDRTADIVDPRDDERFAAGDFDDDDFGLLGGAADRPTRRVVAESNVGAYPQSAFRECLAETRGAAGAGGMMVAMPAEPTKVETLADGSVRMTALFTASNYRGEQWRRAMICEADESGVLLLEVG